MPMWAIQISICESSVRILHSQLIPRLGKALGHWVQDHQAEEALELSVAEKHGKIDIGQNF